MAGGEQAGCVGCCGAVEINLCPCEWRGARHPRVQAALGCAGWLGMPCHLQLGFGADGVHSPGRQLPAPPWPGAGQGTEGKLGQLFCSQLCFLSAAEQILLESLELLPCLSPLAPLKTRLQLLPSSACTPRTAGPPALPFCSLPADRAVPAEPEPSEATPVLSFLCNTVWMFLLQRGDWTR